MSNCTCGRTTRPPLCDGSHWLSDEDYKQRTEKLAQLYNKDLRETTNKLKENEHFKNDFISAAQSNSFSGVKLYDEKSYKASKV